MARVIAAQCTCRRVREASRVLTRIYDGALRPTGLRISQLTALAATAMFGEAGTPIGDLAEVLGMDRTTMSRNLRPLESAGMLRVARAPRDARTRLVLLTRSGERAIEAAFPFWQQAQKRVRKLLGSGGLEDFQNRLVRVVGAIAASPSARRGPTD